MSRSGPEFLVRQVGEGDAAAASHLVQSSFSELAAKDWSPDAMNVFLVDSTPDALRRKIAEATFAGGAFRGTEMLGFVLMPTARILGMLFVHPSALRKGIGRSMWELARAHVESSHPDVRTVELNSTPYAFRFYRSLGFVPLSGEFVRDGCRVTRMACWLPARSLGVEL